MASSTSTLVNCGVVMLLLVAVVTPEAGAVNCGQVIQGLLPCLGYLRNGGAITPVCCNGVKSLNNAIKATPERQQACACLKQAAPSFGINFGYANSGAIKCGLNLGVTISPSMDCSRVH